MNEYLHAIFGAVPAIAWVGLLAAFTLGACIPWIAEAKLPQDMNDGHAMLAVYGVAIGIGPLAAVSIWHAWAALTLGLVGSVGAQVTRDVAAKRWPWLSPRVAQKVKETADGAEGYHVPGVPETLWTRPGAAKPEDKTMPKP